MSRGIQWILGISVALLIILGPLGYAQFRSKHFRNFRTVKPGEFYRSGQLTARGLKVTLHDHEFKTIVCLRDGTELPDQEEEAFCNKAGIRYVRIPPRTWWSPDGSVPAEAGVKVFLDVMDNPANYPVLLHCYRGVHRSGAFSAIYRMEFDRWSNARAIEEMRRLGYKDIEDEYDLLGFLESYEPRWSKQTTRANP